MDYEFRLSQEAERDVLNGYVWYEKKRKGLGEEFLEALDTAEKAIVSNPRAFPFRYKKKLRGFVVSRFPYLILYKVDKYKILVISVFNTRQNPERLEDSVR